VAGVVLDLHCITRVIHALMMAPSEVHGHRVGAGDGVRTRDILLGKGTVRTGGRGPGSARLLRHSGGR
jgi:hypothetical protein